MRFKAVSILLIIALGVYSAPMLVYWGVQRAANNMGIRLHANSAGWSGSGIMLTDIEADGIHIDAMSIRPSWSKRLTAEVAAHGGRLQLDQLRAVPQIGHSISWLQTHLICSDMAVIDEENDAAWMVSGRVVSYDTHLHLELAGAGPGGEWYAGLMRDGSNWSGDIEVEQLSARALLGLLERISDDMNSSALCVDAGLLSGHLAIVDNQCSGDMLLAGIRGSCTAIGLSAGIEEGLLSLAGAQGALLTISDGAWLTWGAAGLCDLRGTVLWDRKPILDLSGTLKSDRRKSIHLTSRGAIDGLKTRCELLRIPLKPAIAEVSFNQADDGFITDVLLRDFGRYENQMLTEWIQEWLGSDMPFSSWDAGSLQATASLHWQQGSLQFVELEELRAEDVVILGTGTEHTWGHLQIDSLNARLRGSPESNNWSGLIEAHNSSWATTAQDEAVLTDLQLEISLIEDSIPELHAYGKDRHGLFDILLDHSGTATASWHSHGGLAAVDLNFIAGTCSGNITIANQYMQLPVNFSSQFAERSWVDFVNRPFSSWLHGQSFDISSFMLAATAGEHSCDLEGHGTVTIDAEGISSELYLAHGHGDILGHLWDIEQAVITAHHDVQHNALKLRSELPLAIDGEMRQVLCSELHWNQSGLQARAGPREELERWQFAWLPQLGRGYIDRYDVTQGSPQLELATRHEEQQLVVQAEGIKRSMLEGFSAQLQVNAQHYNIESLHLSGHAILMQNLLKGLGYAQAADRLMALGESMQLHATWDEEQPVQLHFCARDSAGDVCSISGGYDGSCLKVQNGHLGPFVFQADLQAGAEHITISEAAAHLGEQQALQLRAFSEHGLLLSLQQQAWSPLLQQAYKLWPGLQQVASWIEPVGPLQLVIATDEPLVEASSCRLRLGGLAMQLRNLSAQPLGGSWIAEGSFCNGGSYDPFKLSLESGSAAGSGHLEMCNEHLHFGWESNTAGLTPLCICGDFCGQRLHLLLNSAEQNALQGTIVFDFEQMHRLLEPAAWEALSKLGITGKLTFDGTVIVDGDRIKLQGKLYGDEVSLLHVIWEHFAAYIDTDSDRITLQQIAANANGASLEIDQIVIAQDDTAEWQLAIPKLRASGLVANKLRWPGQQQRGLQHLKIESFGLDNIVGKLTQPQSWLGRGFVHFDNETPRPIFILIPAEILSNIGLDPALLEPVKGTVRFAFEDGWIRLKELENVCSRKQRSKFMLHEDPGFALISWDGQLYLRLRMKQNVLFSLTESLNLYITGTVWNPEISFQHSEQRYAPLLHDSTE